MNWFKKIFHKKPKIIVVLGPTATGKTSLSIELARRFNGEVISADSRQVYKGLDIGTAKVTKEEMKGIPHHMIDVADPMDRYTVALFVQHARKIISDIYARRKTPIICGGTGLYIDALVMNQSFPEVPPNQDLRQDLESMTTNELFQQLQQKDSIRATTIDRHNRQRLIRALEITNAIGGVPQRKQQHPLYHTLFIGLDLSKDEHNQNIRKRIIERIEHGKMLDEARTLHKNGLSYKRMKELGLEYRYMAEYLEHNMTLEEMIDQLEIATRQFAKRQRTWFKRNTHIHWFDLEINQKKINQLVEYFLNNKRLL